MDTVLFRQATPPLDEVINGWFKDHPGVLDAMEEVEVTIKTKRKCPVRVIVDGVDIPSADSLESILCQPVDILIKHLPERFYRERINNTFENAGITTIRQLVQKSDREMLKYRNFGHCCLWRLRNALKEIDPRLFPGMIPSSEGW